jgi:hypothetical protein
MEEIKVGEYVRDKTGVIIKVKKIEKIDGIGSWLKAEHKEIPKISDAERVILENVDKKYKWICRDNYNIIYFCRSEPRKSGNEWQCDNGGVALSIFNHLFQFIKWEDEQAYNIEELLK